MNIHGISKVCVQKGNSISSWQYAWPHTLLGAFQAGLPKFSAVSQEQMIKAGILSFYAQNTGIILMF